jgi:hypothetical protein
MLEEAKQKADPATVRQLVCACLFFFFFFFFFLFRNIANFLTFFKVTRLLAPRHEAETSELKKAQVLYNLFYSVCLFIQIILTSSLFSLDCFNNNCFILYQFEEVKSAFLEFYPDEKFESAEWSGPLDVEKVNMLSLCFTYRTQIFVSSFAIKKTERLKNSVSYRNKLPISRTKTARLNPSTRPNLKPFRTNLTSNSIKYFGVKIKIEVFVLF